MLVEREYECNEDNNKLVLSEYDWKAERNHSNGENYSTDRNISSC